MDYNFAEVIKQFDKICSKYGDQHCECPVGDLIDMWEHSNDKEWNGHCLEFAKMCPDAFAEEVMSWEEEEEEPIYPTIREVMDRICLMMGYKQGENLEYFLDKRLSEEVADLFGIEPINKNKLV